ncbi:MAG: hypothetical protein ACT4QC_01075 [Planctomycetaceae bacterium]
MNLRRPSRGECCTSSRRFRAGARLWPLLVVMACPAVARADAISVAEFNAKVEHWRAARKDPPAVQLDVEGRMQRLGPRSVRFKECLVPIELEADLPAPTRRNPNAQATGVVVRDPVTGGYSFRVQEFRELPADVERFLETRRHIRGQPAVKWFELGDWARARGEFYKDDELIARSDEAYQEAIELERRETGKDNPQLLFDLAGKAARYRLSPALSDQLRFEGAWRLWKSQPDVRGAALDTLIETLAEHLAGATEPAPTLPADMRKQLEVDPLEAYRLADQVGRATFRRLLYALALERKLSLEVLPDASNGFAVAENIDRLLPERRALAEQLRDRALAARSRDVEKLLLPDVLDLTQKYRDLKQPALAEHLIETWLTLHRRKLEPDDTEGLLQLTESYRSLLKRDEFADRLLIAAWERNRSATDIAERLQQAGYRLKDGRWLSERELRALPLTPIEQAIRDGRVESGMTASQVRRSLGEPQTVARSVTSGQVVEVWSFDQAGATRLIVRLRKSRRQSEAVVAEVSQVPKS